MMRINKELARAEKVVSAYAALCHVRVEIASLQEVLDSASSSGGGNASEDDDELSAMAEEELGVLSGQVPTLEQDLAHLLLPSDTADEAGAIVEVRAGTGGDEAALFAQELLKMYELFARKQGWRFELLSTSMTENGGYKEASASVTGEEVYGVLKFESGVHRVQRIPATETQGRVHTSTASVAILPQAEEVDVVIRDEDLRIDVMRASGAGGQHVNCTNSAVRITHIPSGVVVAIQDERSQHKNKDKALKVLRARIYEAERRKVHQTRADQRKSLIGSGDRSERVRTYNFKEGRVKDHRVVGSRLNIEGGGFGVER
jgi:peptide chain release factor 1